jgi:hypothetical protein
MVGKACAAFWHAYSPHSADKEPFLNTVTRELIQPSFKTEVRVEAAWVEAEAEVCL